MNINEKDVVEGLTQALVDQWGDRIDHLEKAVKQNQESFDDAFANGAKRTIQTKQKNLGALIYEQLLERKDEVQKFQTSQHNRLTLEIKTMLTSGVTGDTQLSYNTQQAIEGSHVVNFRDLIPTTASPTGTMVTYREGPVTNGFTNQTEGAAKATQEYTWIEDRAVSQYLSATSRFSKQLMFSLPFLQNTLTVELLRDFYKKENDLFYAAASIAATGDPDTTGAANTAEQILQLIANQLDASFVPSFVIVKPSLWSQILATSKGTGYGFPGGVSVDSNGNTRIGGSRLIAAPWADPDTILLFDASRIERLETESVRVQFSFEDQDNFIKNLVTARIEAFECLNVLRPDSIITTATS